MTYIYLLYSRNIRVNTYSPSIGTKIIIMIKNIQGGIPNVFEWNYKGRF